VNHSRLPKEDLLPDWARWDNKVTKDDRVDTFNKSVGSSLSKTSISLCHEYWGNMFLEKLETHVYLKPEDPNWDQYSNMYGLF